MVPEQNFVVLFERRSVEGTDKLQSFPQSMIVASCEIFCKQFQIAEFKHQQFPGFQFFSTFSTCHSWQVLFEEHRAIQSANVAASEMIVKGRKMLIVHHVIGKSQCQLGFYMAIEGQ